MKTDCLRSAILAIGLLALGAENTNAFASMPQAAPIPEPNPRSYTTYQDDSGWAAPLGAEPQMWRASTLLGLDGWTQANYASIVDFIQESVGSSRPLRLFRTADGIALLVNMNDQVVFDMHPKKTFVEEAILLFFVPLSIDSESYVVFTISEARSARISDLTEVPLLESMPKSRIVSIDEENMPPITSSTYIRMYTLVKSDGFVRAPIENTYTLQKCSPPLFALSVITDTECATDPAN